MLKFESIQKCFNQGTLGEIHLYKDLNLAIKPGQFVTIIGSNGSGKSTLLNLITGQVAPDYGTVSFNNKNLLKIPHFKRFKKISRVYQDPLAGTAPSLTVLENLCLALNKGKLFSTKKAILKSMSTLFTAQLKMLDMGLEDKLDVRVSKLSGGQRQALSLLMALMNDPELVLLDEHTAALDPKVSESIMKLTHKMVSSKNITTLMVTHNLQHALDYGDRIIMFHEGTVVLDVEGKEKENLTREVLIQKFMEVHDDILPSL